MLFPVTYWFGNNTLLFAGEDRSVICSRDPFILNDAEAPVPDGYVRWRQVQPITPLIFILSPEDGLSDGSTFVQPLIFIPIGFDSAQTIVLEVTNLITGETSRVSIDHNLIETLTVTAQDDTLLSSSGRGFYGSGEQITSVSFSSLDSPPPGEISFADTLTGNIITWNGIYTNTKPKSWLVYAATLLNPTYNLVDSLDFNPNQNYTLNNPGVLDNPSYHSIRVDILDQHDVIITGDSLFLRRVGSSKRIYADEPIKTDNISIALPTSEISYSVYRIYVADIFLQIIDILQTDNITLSQDSSEASYNDYRFYLIDIFLSVGDTISLNNVNSIVTTSTETTYSSYFYSLGGIQI
jgi:hypothetical protein